MTGSSVYDTLSSSAAFVTASGTPSSPPVKYAYTNPEGGTSYVTVTYVNYTVQTNFGCSGVGEYNQSNIPLVDTITMPDNVSKYTFVYEETPGNSAHTTGRLAEVTLPSGGIIQYSYTGGNHGVVCSDGSAAGLLRTVTPGGAWTYSRTDVSGKHWQTTVTTPGDPTVGDETVIDFWQDSASSYPTTNFYEVQRKVYQGSSTLLATFQNCYNGNFGACVTTPVSTPITRLDSYREFAGGKTSAVETIFNTNGMMTEKKEYDFGVTLGAAPSSSYLLRDTVIAYASLGNGLIVDHPSQVTVKDGSGNVKAQTTYSYDQYSVTTTSGTPQLTSPPNGARGNLTTASSLTSGSSTISKHFTYYDTGNVHVATDVNAATTTYKYGSGTSCGNSFPTEIDMPLSLTTDATWNCSGGVMTTAEDVNGNTTTYKYTDPHYWRLMEVDKPSGGVTTYAYNNTSTPWWVQTSVKQTSSANVTTKVVLDGLGRTSQTQLASDPGGTDYVDTTYDLLGRVYSVSNPHRTGSSPTDGTTDYTYDALNRPTQTTLPDGDLIRTLYYNNTLNWNGEGNATAKFFQVDGLGRLTSVCERILDGHSGVQANGDAPLANNCNSDYSTYPGFQTTYGYDALDDLISVTQNANNSPYLSQTRSYQYDGLSRLTNEINPENGTTTYVYDTLHGGDLYTRTSGEPNSVGTATTTATYTFDLLHRITNVTHTDPYTTPKYFYWDTQSWWNGVTPNYPKGRLARENSSACGTTCAGEEYNYDIDGNVVGKVSWGPSNVGHAVASYYSYNLMDQQTSMTDIWGHVLTTGYQNSGGDATGYPNQLTSSLNDSNHPSSLYSVGAINPLGEPYIVTLGNGIVRTLSYDNRGRLTGITDGPTGSPVYSLAVGYANGRVSSVTDSINGTWTYGYDDFGRLSSSSCTANCPNGTSREAFSYSYDEYGNRWNQTVTAGSGPSPSYQFDINNHLWPTNCTNGTMNFCYDNAGNLKYDGVGGNWAPDSDGLLFGYDSSSMTATYTYDAIGQRLERTLNGITYDYAFDNQGKENTKGSVGFAGWDWSELYLGGAHAGTYAAGSTYFSHTDNLGSERMETDPNGNTNGSFETNLPFGEWTSSGMQSEKGFTGDLFDNTDGYTFHTNNRQYNQTQGRWMIPDPAGLAAVDPTNPQTWNRYAYVTNNPLNFVDRRGLNQDDGDCGDDDCSDDGGGDAGGAAGLSDEQIQILDTSGDNPYALTSDPGYDPNAPTFQTTGIAYNPGNVADTTPAMSADLAWDLIDQSGVGIAANNSSTVSAGYTVNVIASFFYGLGPAFTYTKIPSLNLTCVGGGLGASAGHNFSFGPTVVSTQNAKSILSSWSFSAGYNFTPWLGGGGSANSSGAASGNTFGVPGAGAAVTWSKCWGG